MHTVQLQEVSFRYPTSQNTVIKGLNWSISGSQSIGVIGTNGSGKTTFMKLLLGLLKPTNGIIHLNGINTKNLSKLKEFVAYLPENAKLILLGPTIRKDFIRLGIEEKAIEKIFEKYEIESLADQKLYHLSEGQRRLCAIILLFNLPRKKILFIDEPTIGLDRLNRKKFLNAVNEAKNKDQIVFVSTNDSRILPHLDHLLVIEERSILIEGSPKTVLYRLENETSIIPNQIVRVLKSLNVHKEFTFTTIDELNNFIQGKVK